MKRYYFFIAYVISSPHGFSFGRSFLNLSEKSFDIEHAEGLIKRQPGNTGKEVVILSYKEISEEEFEVNS